MRNLRRLKRIVTLITEAQAKVGTKFSVRIMPSCRKCKLFNICMGRLREGLVYEVVKVRRIKHKCPHTGATMVVVEVTEAPKLALLPSRHCYEGAIISYKPVKCTRVSCPYYRYCRVSGISSGEKVLIERVLDEKVVCPIGSELRFVLLRRLAAFT